MKKTVSAIVAIALAATSVVSAQSLKMIDPNPDPSYDAASGVTGNAAADRSTNEGGRQGKKP